MTTAPTLPDASAVPSRARAPRRLIIIGGVLAALGTVAFLAGFGLMGVTMFDAVDQGLNPTKHLDLVLDVPGRGTVTLEAGRYQVVALGPSLTVVTGSQSDAGGQDVHRSNFPDPDVTITSPDGDPVVLSSPSMTRVSRTPGIDAVGVYEFQAAVAGTYTVEVAGERGAVTQVGIGEAKDLWEEARGWIASAVVITIGSLVATLGFTLLIVGIVWWLIDRSRTTGPPAAPPGWGPPAMPYAAPPVVSYPPGPSGPQAPPPPGPPAAQPPPPSHPGPIA